MSGSLIYAGVGEVPIGVTLRPSEVLAQGVTRASLPASGCRRVRETFYGLPVPPSIDPNVVLIAPQKALFSASSCSCNAN